MSEGNNKVLGYLDYKNKQRTLEWEERLWRLRLGGSLPDHRGEEDRRRYSGLMARLEQARTLAGELRGRREPLVHHFVRSVATN
jgi:hypothetical protein